MARLHCVDGCSTIGRLPGTRPGRAALLGVLVAATSVGAQAVIDLPPECGTSGEFQRELARLVGPNAVVSSPYSVRLTGPDPAGAYRLDVRVDGTARELSHTDCRTLTRSAAVVIATAMRPDLGSPATKGPARAPSAGAPAPKPDPARPTEPDRSPEEPRAEPLRGGVSHIDAFGRVSAGAGAALGFLPSVAPLFEVRTAAGAGAWGGWLALRYLPAQTVEQSGRRVDVAALAGRAGAAYEPTNYLLVSAGLDVGWYRGEGAEGIPNRRVDTAWSVAPAVELALAFWNAEPWRLELGLEARYALVRPRFIVNGFREVYRVPPVGAASTVRLVWSFL